MTSRVLRGARLAVVASAWLGAVGLRAAGVLPGDDAASFAPPARLSATGLYADPATLAIDPRNRPFAPQYPLWSDGATKRRWVRLPDGAPIDARDAERWVFPIGTRFWKEFAFDGRRVETRVLWKVTADEWTFASYAWSDDQRDATLVPAEGQPQAAAIAPGKWHHIPSQAECRACHDSGRTEPLGFSPLQLSGDRDPLAPHAEPVSASMVTLATLVGEGQLTGFTGDVAPRIAARTPIERAALGYLSTNCGSCHNRQSTIASLGLFLKHTPGTAGPCGTDVLATTLDRTGHWTVPDAPPGTSRVVAAGDTTRSALYRRAASRRPSSQMPPIGTVVTDRAALDLLSRWIVELGAAPCAGVRSH